MGREEYHAEFLTLKNDPVLQGVPKLRQFAFNSACNRFEVAHGNPLAKDAELLDALNGVKRALEELKTTGPKPPSPTRQAPRIPPQGTVNTTTTGVTPSRTVSPPPRQPPSTSPPRVVPTTGPKEEAIKPSPTTIRPEPKKPSTDGSGDMTPQQTTNVRAILNKKVVMPTRPPPKRPEESTTPEPRGGVTLPRTGGTGPKVTVPSGDQPPTIPPNPQVRSRSPQISTPSSGPPPGRGSGGTEPPRVSPQGSTVPPRVDRGPESPIAVLQKKARMLLGGLEGVLPNVFHQATTRLEEAERTQDLAAMERVLLAVENKLKEAGIEPGETLQEKMTALVNKAKPLLTELKGPRASLQAEYVEHIKAAVKEESLANLAKVVKDLEVLASGKHPPTESPREPEVTVPRATTPVKGLSTKAKSKLAPVESQALRSLAGSNAKLAEEVESALGEIIGEDGELPPRLTGPEAGKIIAASSEKANAAAIAQYRKIRDALDDLWEEAGKELGASLNPFVAEFNRRTTAALNKYNTHAPGAYEEAAEDLRKLWEDLKAKSATAAQKAAAKPNFKDYLKENGNLTTAKTEKANAEKARATSALLEAVCFGPLSRPLPPETDRVTAAARAKATTDILKKFKDHPETAYDALEMVGRTTHPETLAKGVDVIGKLRAGNFSTGTKSWPSATGKMSRNALEMGGLLGGNYFEEMEAFYAAKKHATDDPLSPSTDAGGQTKGTAYTRKIADGLVGTDGKVNFNAPGLKPTMDNLKFHPSSLQAPLFGLVANLEEVRDKFTKPPGTTNPYVTKLGTVTAPTSGGHGEKAKGLIRGCLGLPGSQAPTDLDAKRAVLSAMITPFAQGPVGSCFATGPCLKFKEGDPLAYMTDLTEIVKTGTITKGGRPPLPVITNLPPTETNNPLMRSWEYSVTTMGARLENSREKKKLSDALFGDSTKSFGALGLDRVGQEKIKTAVGRAFTFSYDPVAELSGVSADGSSTKGKWVLQRVGARGEETSVETQEAFLATLKTTVEKELDPDGRLAPDSDLKKKLNALFTDPLKADFVKHVRTGFDKGKGAPWNMSGGGSGEGPTEVLFGRSRDNKAPEEDKFYNPTSTTGNKAGALLSSMVTKLQGATTKHVTVSISGIHGMNLLPNHPSMVGLRPGGGKTTEQKVREQLIEPGRRFAERKPKERMAVLHGKVVSSVLGSLFDGDASGLAALRPPTTDQTPGELKAAILEQAKTKIAAKVEAEMSNSPEKVTRGIQAKFQARVEKHEADCRKIEAEHEKACAEIDARHKEACAQVRARDQENQNRILNDHQAAKKRIRDKYEADFKKYETGFEDYRKQFEIYRASPTTVRKPTAPTAPGAPVYPPEPTLPRATPLPTRPPNPPAPTLPPAPQRNLLQAQLQAEYKADLSKAQTTQLANGIDNILLKEMAPPEFVIADTNWGNQIGHVFHVIAPDPDTGDPVLWKKEEPTMTYTRETTDWLDAEWGVLKKGAEFT